MVVVVGGTVVVTGSGAANVGAGTWYGPPGGVPCTYPRGPGSTGGSVVGGVGRNATAGLGRDDRRRLGERRGRHVRQGLAHEAPAR